jgi:multiple sugar transport system substrate-binding protein
MTWWGNTVRDERTIKTAKLYESKNPGVTIDTETTGWGGYWDKVNTQAASNNLPDIMQHDWAYITQWANRNQLLDLTPYAQNGTIDLSKISESALSSGRINGKLYAISMGTNAYGVTIDPAVLEKAGIGTIDSTTWTWKDYERIALTVFEKTGIQTLPFSPTSPYNVLENMVRQTGKPFYNADGKSLGFTDPAIVKEFFDIQLRLKAAGALLAADEAFITASMEEEPFVKGKTWNEFVYSNQLVAEAAAARRPIAELLLPKIDNSQRFGTYLKPSQFFSITAKAKNPDLAAKVLNFYLNDKEANDILMAERGVPIPDDVRAYLAPKVDPMMKVAFDYVTLASTNSSPMDNPDPPAAGEVMASIRDITVRVLSGQLDSTAGATQLMTSCNKILSGQ